MAGQPPLVKNLLHKVNRGMMTVNQLVDNLRAAQSALDAAQASSDPEQQKKVPTYRQAVAMYSMAVMKCGKTP